MHNVPKHADQSYGAKNPKAEKKPRAPKAEKAASTKPEKAKAAAKEANLAVKKPTIHEALREKLGREPTNSELKADVDRIKQEGLAEAATQGKLRHQRKSKKAA